MNDNADVNDMPLTLDAEYLRNDTWLLQTTNTLYFKKTIRWWWWWWWCQPI